MRKVNELLVDSTTDVILQFKPLFDEQKQILALLQAKLQSAYSMKNPVKRAKIFLDLRMNTSDDLEDMENQENARKYRLKTATTFDNWNEIAKDVNKSVQNVCVACEFSEQKIEIMTEKDSSSSSISSSKQIRSCWGKVKTYLHQLPFIRKVSTTSTFQCFPSLKWFCCFCFLMIFTILLTIVVMLVMFHYGSHKLSTLSPPSDMFPPLSSTTTTTTDSPSSNTIPPTFSPSMSPRTTSPTLLHYHCILSRLYYQCNHCKIQCHN
jgi:hypothetical protein